MGKNKSWFDISNEDRKDWENLCPLGEYRVISGSNLPGPIPQEFKNKCVNVFVMASGSGSYNQDNDIAYFMLNYNRLDFEEKEIDQQPFGLAFIGQEPQYSGTFIHHGDWENRSTDVPEGFMDKIENSKLSYYANLGELPEKTSGKLEDLNIDSHFGAFKKIVSILKSHINKLK